MIKKTIRGFSLLAFSLAGLGMLGAQAHADQLDAVKERGKLIVGIKNDYQPFGWLAQDGQLTGFEIDLAKAVAKELVGSETAVEMVPVVASNRIELLNAGRVDVLLATLGVNESRANVVDFTDEYYMMAGLVFLAPVDTDIAKWEDLKGRQVCGMQGNLYNRTLTQKFGAKMLLYAGTAEMFKSFQSGRCQGVAFDGPILQQKTMADGWSGKYKIAIETLEYIPIAGGVRKNEPRFLEAVNKAIRKAEANDVLVTAEQTYEMGQTEHVLKRAAAAVADQSN